MHFITESYYYDMNVYPARMHACAKDKAIGSVISLFVVIDSNITMSMVIII